jgi:chitodextrinase
LEHPLLTAIPILALQLLFGSASTSAQTAPGTPTLVQHVATGMDRYPVTNLRIPLPNPAGAGNALIVGVQFRSSGSISSVADAQGNTWVAGPTVTNSNASQRMSLYYALNVIGGTQNITVTFSGLGSTNAFPQAVVSEFYNVAQVSAADGSSGSATSRTAGAITTTAAGDLIYQWGVDFSDTNVNGGAYNGGSITAGAGFTLLSADLQVGSADQYQVQSSAASINPTFTASGAATWGSLALALKSASAGTPPPPGIRIVHIQHTLLNSVRAQGRPNAVVMQFPSSGNLLVGLYNSAGVLVSSVSDSAHNTWASAGSTTGGSGGTGAQIMYAANAATSPALSGITVVLNGTTQGDDMFNLYDIAGAATSPFDKSNTALGNQNSPGNLTTTTLAPSTANGLVLNVVSIDYHTINGIVGSNYVMDSDVNDFDNNDPQFGGTDVSTLDMDNGYAHIYNTTTDAVTFVYTYSQTTPGGVQLWGSVAAAFTASGGGGGDTTQPTTPTSLVATAVSSSQVNLSWTASTDNVGVTGYKAFRGGTQIGTSAANSFSDTGLTASTTYSYTVSAYDAAGNNSGQSSAVQATTQTALDTTPPTVPTSLSVTGTTTSTVSLSWSASTDNAGVAGYKIYRGGIQIGTSGVAAYTDTGLTASTTYTYAVSAYDAAGNSSAQTTPVSATTGTPDTQAPTVSIASPANNQTVSGITAITANAADNVGHFPLLRQLEHQPNGKRFAFLDRHRTRRGGQHNHLFSGDR